MPGNGSTIQSRIKKLLRSPSVKHRKRRKESLSSKVTLENVLGITASGSSGLACDPRSGLVAYPAGCVVVLLNPKKNKQNHIINASRKTITALSFSPDGKYLVTGESGHLPAVRLWDVAGRRQVAELQKHKYGVTCVAFSPSGKHVVTVGNQHDMTVNVWAWKKDVVVAVNKVSSKVTVVSFSENSSYFVTAGNRHVKFWYLDPGKATKASTPVPLLGRAALLGDLRNNFFCDVACGRGSRADATFCITSSGLLCQFSARRTLDQWVDLRTGAAHSLSLSDDLIFCGCVDGTVRAFSPVDLHFVCTLPRPHPLRADGDEVSQASQLSSSKKAVRWPDTTAVTYDPASRWLSCVYSDHSLYVWDVRDPRRVSRVHSELFHAACVWDLQMFPEASEGAGAGLSPGVFLSCSADNTIRLWRPEQRGVARNHTHNLLGNDLLRVIYVDGGSAAAALLDTESTAGASVEKAPGESQLRNYRAGVRSVCVSPDGKHLASGGRNGVLRVYDLSSMEEILKVDAHDAEILCLEYSKPETGLKLLATASRDRLIHILDTQDGYSLLQTLDEHSSSITAVRFAANDNRVRIISCGADKSIYFYTAHKMDGRLAFRRTHHVARKTTLYDMDIHPSSKYAAVACQDRCIRIFNISSGKQKKVYKGSLSEDGSLLRVQMDPSGLYVATSCSDKNINLYDFHAGECVATMFGHSEIVTGIKFTSDCKHLISVSGDSCIFVWRLAPELTARMRERLARLRHTTGTHPYASTTVRRELHRTHSFGGLSSDSEDAAEHPDDGPDDDLLSSSSSDGSQEDEDTGGSDEGLDWQSTQVCSSPVTLDPGRQPRRRWSDRMGPLVKSMLDLRQLEHRRSPASGRRHLEAGGSFTLQESVLADRPKKQRPWSYGDWLSFNLPRSSKETEGSAFWPDGRGSRRSLQDSDYLAKERCRVTQGLCGGESQGSLSPDSACCLGYDSRERSSDYTVDDMDGIEALGSDSSDQEQRGGREEEEEEGLRGSSKPAVTSMDEALRTVTDALYHEDFLRKNYETLADCSTAEQTNFPRPLSMSSHFLARGHNSRGPSMFTKAHDKEPGSPAAKPQVSRVRPLMADSHIRATKGPDNVAGVMGAPGGDVVLQHRWFQRKKRWLPESHPSLKAPLLAAAALQRAQSVENLRSDSAPPLPPPACEQPLPLPAPPSPPPPPLLLPWERPQARRCSSYMSPTTSSRLKCSRRSSFSAGEGLLDAAAPPFPSSPCLRRRPSSGLLAFQPLPLPPPPPLFLPSPPVSSCSRCLATSLSCPLPKGSAPSQLAPPPLPPPVSPGDGPLPPVSPGDGPPTPFSRVPLPRQPPGPRRYPEERQAPRSDWSESQARAATPLCETGARPVLGRQLSVDMHVTSSPPAPARQARRCVSVSVNNPKPPVVAEERPLLAIRASTLLQNVHPDQSVTVETCKQVIAELHGSLRRTALLYTTLLASGSDPSPAHWEMRRVLADALGTARAELDALPSRAVAHPGGGQGDCGVVEGDEGDGALALLEQFSELLLKSVERRLETSKT